MSTFSSSVYPGRLDHFEPVPQRRGNPRQVVGRRDEQDLGEVERDVEVDIAEARVLFGVEHLEQGRRRVAVVVRAAAHLVELVQNEHGVADLGLHQRADDPARRGRPERGRQAADGGLVPRAPEGDGHRRAAHGRADQLGERRLAAARRSGETEDRGAGGGPGRTHDEAPQPGRRRRVPAAGPDGALHRPRPRGQQARGQEPPDARLDLRPAGVRRVQRRHRRLDVHPLRRPRRPRQGGHRLQPFERDGRGFGPQGLRQADLVERAGQHLDRQVGGLQPTEHVPGRGSQRHRRLLFFLLQTIPHRLELVARVDGQQQLSRVLEALQHLPDPTERGVVPRPGRDGAAGGGDGADAADRLAGGTLEPPKGLVARRGEPALRRVPSRVLSDPPQEHPERGQRRCDLQGAEIELAE